jgi:hypothetical protein
MKIKCRYVYLNQTASMNIPLTDFEIEILNKVVPTQTLSNPASLPLVLRGIIDEEKEKLMATGMSDNDFRLLQSQASKNIFHFLRENEFYYEREGGVFYLTDKGKHLQKQKTIQNYVSWIEKRAAVNLAELHTIEERGYLDKDQHIVVDKKNNVRKFHEKKKEEPKPKFRQTKLFPIVVIVVLVIAGLIAHYFKLV